MKIAIMSHITPDGDAVGSLIGAYHLIKDNFGIEPVMILDDQVPQNFKFLAGADKIKRPREIAHDYIPDAAIALDAAQFYRLGAAGEIFNRAGRRIKIDHHINSEPYGNKNIVHEKCSSVSEILADMTGRLKWRISKDAANALAVGIFLDTNRFSVNMQPRTFDMLSRLVLAGAELEKIQFETGMQSKNIFQAFSYLCDNAKFEFNDKLVYCLVTDEVYKRFNVSYKEIKGSALLLALQNIRESDVAIVFYALNKGCYVSMRGKTIPVRPIGEALGGRGHEFATGVDLPEVRAADAVPKLLELFRGCLASG